MGFLQAVGQASPAILSNIGQMKQMAIQDQQEKREAVKFEYLQKKMIDEERQENAPVPLSLLQTTPLAQHPRAFNLLLENARQNGAIGKTVSGEEFITKKNLKGVLDTMKLGTEAGNMWIGELLNDKKAQVATLYQTMQSGKVKKPEELEQLKNQYKSATEDLVELTRLNDPDFIKEYVKTQNNMREALYKEQIKPPDVQDFQSDRTKIQKEWSPVTKTWTEVGRGPMDAPEKPVIKETADGKIVWVNPPPPQGSVATPGGSVQGQPPPMVTEVPGITVRTPGKSEEKLIEEDLTSKLGRAPTPREILNEKQRMAQTKPLSNIQEAHTATTLRKEFNNLGPVKEFREIDTKFDVMEEAMKEAKQTKNFVAVDQALITLYNKMTDPNSVVRESEYARTPQDMAVLNRLKATYSRWGAGGRLEPDTRKAILDMASKFKTVYSSKYGQLKDEWRGYAKEYGIDPEKVLSTQDKSGVSDVGQMKDEDLLKALGISQ